MTKPVTMFLPKTAENAAMSESENVSDDHATVDAEVTDMTSQLLAMAAGLGQTQVISLATKLGIADRLKQGALTAEQLSQETDIPTPRFERLMRILVQMGLFDQADGNRYKCTKLGTLLQEDSPHSIRHFAMHVASDSTYQTWPHLLTGLQTGKSVFKGVLGESAYSLRTPEENALFLAGMGDVSRHEGNAIVEVYDFSNCHKIVDVGGGQGGLLAAILRRYPDLRGLLFELPNAAESANAVLGSDELKGRCEVVSGNFLESVPAGGDLYMLKRIMMDSTDEEARTLLANIKQAIEHDGRLLIFDPDYETLWGKLLDLVILMNNAGRLRTVQEMTALVEDAGFELVRAIDTGSPTGMLMYEARPVAR